MTPKGDRELTELRSAFSELFGVKNPRPFGRATHRYQGFSDDARGVQWNAGIDRERGVYTMGVNLEGMKYDDWPIARFIERELDRPEFPTLVSELSDPTNDELWWSRDAWQAAARLPIVEGNIGDTPPVPLSKLTPTLWRDMLREAYECLDATRGYRGRAIQRVTLSRSGKADKSVSPHLQIKRILWKGSMRPLPQGGRALDEARLHLQPIYRFVLRRATP